MQEEASDLRVHINGQHTFLLSQRVMCAFSGRLRKTLEHERWKSVPETSVDLTITDFPGGADGFELVARFCYNNGMITITSSNICFLHCAAVFLEMTEEFMPCNLLTQTETLLDGIFQWTWEDVLKSMSNCEQFIQLADISGLLQRLIYSLLTKISANSESSLKTMMTPVRSSSSSASSPEPFGFVISGTTRTPDNYSPSSSKEWWFDDLRTLHPRIIEKLMKTVNAYGGDNKNLMLTKFLLYYLNYAVRTEWRTECGGLADTVVHGVVLMGKKAFSCRRLFWVLRVVSCLGPSEDCRQKLENLTGFMLDQAILDDLLVSGHGPAYDVDLVLRLARIFVSAENDGQRLKKVGRLLDKYLREISPDQSLKASKFLGLAESLPDSARDCFDEVYRALDIYIESHPGLSLEDRSRLCRCLNYEKLTPDACRDLAKNPRIPPRTAVQALLVLQQSRPQAGPGIMAEFARSSPWPEESQRTMVSYKGPIEVRELTHPTTSDFSEEELRIHLQKMQWKVMELEKACKEMKGQMSRMAVGDDNHTHKHSRRHGNHRNKSRGLPRLC